MYNVPLLRKVNVVRYVTPLREGGSLPAIAEADDDFLYVLKFRGAGQGIRSLIAELVGGELARALGLKVPELVFAWLDNSFGRTEPDEEIQHLLRASEGLNLALHYLSGSLTYDPAVMKIESATASKIVWLDSLLMNVDRTPRNTNLLMWNKELWLIDHGAALYFHHNWQSRDEYITRPFVQIRDHVLLPQAMMLDQAASECKSILTEEVVEAILKLVPDDWIDGGGFDDTPDIVRRIYTDFLMKRLSHSTIFENEAKTAALAYI